MAFVAMLLFGIPNFVSARTGNDPKTLQTSYEQLGLYKAWDYTVGSSEIIVAIIDNGFDTFHPDIRPNVWINSKEIPDNKIDDDKNGYADDIYGWNFLDNNNNPLPAVENLSDFERADSVFSHGSIVAGIIGAAGNNNQDGVGVNWRVKLMNLKVVGNNGFGELTPLSTAIRYAVNNGADVINISMVGDRDNDMLEAINYAAAKGVVVVAAMGNYNGNLNNNLKYPVCADADSGKNTVLGVSAVGNDRKLAYFSNIGSKCVDITAPGVDIGSTVRYSPENKLNITYSKGWQGTSFAAPFVSGAAALVKSLRPEWKAPQIYDALLSTVHHTPSNDEADYANIYGKGFLQIHRAVAYAKGIAIPPTIFNDPSIQNVVTSTNSSSAMPGPNVKTFTFAWSNGTMRDAYENDATVGVPYEREESKGVEDIAVIGSGRDQKIITVKKKNKSERLVSMYNSRWQNETEWIMNATGPLSVSAGIRDGVLIIALAPNYPDTRVYTLYNGAGEFIEEKKLEYGHSGARAIVKDHSIYAILNHTAGKKQTVNIIHYKDGEIFGEFTANAFTGFVPRSVPPATIGDLIGDSELEIIIGSPTGSPDAVAVYTLNGELVREFSPFGDGKNAGVNVAVFDANADGFLDIVTSAIQNPASVRAWTPRAKPVNEWNVSESGGSLFVIPRK